ncbi:hypothetical protein ES332_A08G189900v1 [Gossypium tomentosum]|uniref:RNase H type-1 domain-containing protein n=1 Tax=Gossypium tomentosum TaxID=34277 RepID=A0A5D2PHL8_GOSTO|nr:hypothetical protein ES332_A08G189900v1 [Gossypium tomentosum]
MWKISWNYIPTLVNIKLKRVVAEAWCPRCRLTEEDSIHVFRQCSTTEEVWKHLCLAWVLNTNIQNAWEWLNWVFNQGTNEQYHLFCFGLWLIWSNRNQLLYENKMTNSRDISRQITSYNLELQGLEDKLRICEEGRLHNQDEQRTRVTIHFDAAFDQSSFRSTSGLVVRDMRGEVLVSKSVLHSNVASSFTVEAHAGLQAVRLGIFLGINTCEIFGDSKTVIKKCQKIDFCFIPKTENTLTHIIAREALKEGASYYLENGISEKVCHEFERIRQMRPDI